MCCHTGCTGQIRSSAHSPRRIRQRLRRTGPSTASMTWRSVVAAGSRARRTPPPAPHRVVGLPRQLHPCLPDKVDLISPLASGDDDATRPVRSLSGGAPILYRAENVWDGGGAGGGARPPPP